MQRLRESQTPCTARMSSSTQQQRYLGPLMGALALLLLVVGTSHAEWAYVGSGSYVGTTSFYRLCPTWIGGDREYSSNGPSVYAYTSLSIISGTQLYVKVYMDQLETKSNWSHARFSRSYRLYTAPSGRQIAYTWNASRSEIHYVDTDHAEDVFYPTDTLVREFRIKGDTSGNDIGNCTSDDAYLTVYFEPLWVWLE
jgi:hypothetical protein